MASVDAKVWHWYDEWDEQYRTSMDECGVDRCPINKSQGQCHMRRGHKGMCDPFGHSHLEVQYGTTWG